MSHLPVFQSPLLNSFATIKHGFFTRQGGISAGHYDNLNMALSKTDSVENVMENHRLVGKWFGIEAEHVLSPNQIHSAKVKVLDAPFSLRDKPEVDALITKVKQLAIGILTADCVPVLIYCPDQQLIAAIHAGWKGAKAGVVGNTVAKLASQGAQVSNMVAVLGPSIHQPSYEVDHLFYTDFMNESACNQLLFKPSQRINHYYFDLPGYVLEKLKQAGILQVDMMKYDTYQQEHLFFSCRRAFHKRETVFGNQISAIMLA